MTGKVRVTRQPHKMWAVYRRCNVFKEWSLECICDEGVARAMLRYQDFVGGKKSNTVRLIDLERKIVPVNVSLRRRGQSKKEKEMR